MSTTRIVKQNKPKVFLFFLLFSTLLWVLTKFSKQFTSKVEVAIEYQSLPEDTLLSDAPKSILVNVSANGFEFLFYRLKPTKVSIPLAKYYKNKENKVLIEREALQMEISNALEREAVLTDLSQKSMLVLLDRIASKEVPIRIASEIQLKKGFRQVDSIQITPSSVVVSAPSQVLDKINFVATEKWEAKAVNKNQEKKLKLKLPDFDKTFLNLEEVTASVEVKEYLQKNISVRVQVINKPKDVTLMLIPETISLYVDVDIDSYNNISEKDFLIACDYNERNEKEGVLYAKILRAPKRLYNMHLSETVIDYLIFK